ncbi:MAG TPA: response regulator [Flavisolibacter sp.]|nr:response regulator [Flavisolibacter sp.]
MNTANNYTILQAGASVMHLLLCDDDLDDCLLFKDALAELQISTQFTCVNNGEKLTTLLRNGELFPDCIFLDMNMPGKNGLQCLLEIRAMESLKAIPIIILSTSFQPNMIATLCGYGAMLCLKKPNGFTQLKEVIHSALSLVEQAQVINEATIVSQTS